MLDYIDLYTEYGVSERQTAAFNTAAINQAVIDALIRNKWLLLPPGLIRVNTIIWDPRVSIRGAGWYNTILQSASAVPLIQYNGALYDICAVVEGFTLDGNGIGTIGMDISLFARFLFQNLYFKGFTQFAAKGLGLLIGTWKNCRFINCAAGVDFGTQPAAQFQSNLVKYVDCYWGDNIAGTCLHYDNAASIQLLGCDFEGSGAAGKPLISITFSGDGSGNGSDSGVGLIVFGSWFERNIGSALMDVAGHTSIYSSVFSPGNSGAGIYNRGQLSVYSSNMNGIGSPDIVTDGANATTKLIASTCNSHQELNGGVYTLVA